MVMEEILQKINHGFKIVNIKMDICMGIVEKLDNKYYKWILYLMEQLFILSVKMANKLKDGNDWLFVW